MDMALRFMNNLMPTTHSEFMQIILSKRIHSVLSSTLLLLPMVTTDRIITCKIHTTTLSLLSRRLKLSSIWDMKPPSSTRKCTISNNSSSLNSKESSQHSQLKVPIRPRNSSRSRSVPMILRTLQLSEECTTITKRLLMNSHIPMSVTK